MRFSRELIQPVIVTIIDDDTVEELNESFTVNLDSVPGHPSSIIVVNTPARITIRDNDSEYITYCKHCFCERVQMLHKEATVQPRVTERFRQDGHCFFVHKNMQFRILG